MMFLFIPIIYFYLAYFVQTVFVVNWFSLFIFISLGFIAIRKQIFGCCFLVILLLFLLFSTGGESVTVSLSTEKEDIFSIYCQVISEPSGRKEREKGFRVKLLAVGDSNGNIYSAKGSIYVLSEDSDIHIFDKVHLSGTFSGDLFISKSASVVSGSLFSSLRNKLYTIIRSRLRYGNAGELMQMLILGTGESGTSPLILSATNSGLRHLLALSGMHLAVFDFLFARILRKISPRKGKLFLFLFLLFFTFLSGWKASLLRALLFRLFLSLKFGTKISFCFSAILLLLIFPYYAFDLGAIYSFIALGGILLFSDRIGNSLCFVFPNNKFVLAIGVSISAQMLAIPITFYSFSSYQMMSIFTSFPVSILIFIYMVLAIIFLFIPAIKPVIDIFYPLVEESFRYSSLLKASTSLFPYFVMVLVVLFTVYVPILVIDVKKLLGKIKQ